MKHILRIQLEHKQDVIRDVEIPSDKTLKDLHDTIIETLKLNKNEMASFYITNDELELLQEIPLFKIDDKDNLMFEMNKMTISAAFPNMESQLIYVFDFLKMWRFLISYIKEIENKSRTIITTKKIGEMPKEAPEINFKSDENMNSFNDIEEEFNENFEEFNESEY
tara:strand:- start:138 stop:635 length:498 start_codon:yes stop_codon:yes gene_type:complete